MSSRELARLKRQHERQMTEDGVWCDGWAMCPCRLAQTIRAAEDFKDPRGVAAIPNRCGSCGKFKRWEELTTHFVPDTAFSSEDESWRECDGCREKDRPFMLARQADFEEEVRDTSDAD